MLVSSKTVDIKMQKHFITRIFTSHMCLAFCYGIFLFLYELKFVRDIIPSIHFIFILWSIFLILYDFFIRLTWNKIPYIKFILAFLCTSFFTAIINYETGLVSNIKSWILIAIPILVFYPTCLLNSKTDRKEILLKSLFGASVVSFLSSIVALIMYFLNYSKNIEVAGINKLVGIRYYIPNDPSSGTLLYGIYEDTNHAAIYAIVFAVYSIILFKYSGQYIFKTKRLKIIGKTYAIFNFVVQICYFPLANSRGAWLCLLIALLIVLFIYIYNNVLMDRNRIIRTSISLVVSLLISFSLFAILLFVRSGLSFTHNIIEQNIYAPKVETEVVEEVPEKVLEDNVEVTNDVNNLQTVDNVDSNQNNEVQEKEKISKENEFKKSDDGMGAGRLIIWKEALELFFEKPLIGTGPGNNQYYSLKYDVAIKRIGEGEAIHNSYLDLLVDYGLVGFCIYIFFFFLCLITVLKHMFSDKKPKEQALFGSFFCTIFISGTSFFLSCIFINTTAMYFLMLMFIGYLISDSEIKRNNIS